MSHFTVLVVGEDPEAQLAPFEEQLKVEFYNSEDEKRKDYAEDTTHVFIDLEGVTHSKYDERFRVAGKGFEGSKYVCPDGWIEAEVPVSKLYPTFEQYMSEYCDEHRNTDGKYGYWHNPKAKWDWFLLGGRWTGKLKLKPGSNGVTGKPGLQTSPAPLGWVDQARKSDLDLQGMRDAAKAKAHATYDKYETDQTCDRSKADWIYGIESVLKNGLSQPQSPDDYRIMTRDEHVRASGISTFAVLKEGEWFERGQMGWWGVVRDEKDRDGWVEQFDKLLAELPDDTLLSVYDCHI